MNVDVVATRGAKFRILEAVQKETESLSTKDVENVMAYLGGVLEWMNDGLYSTWKSSGHPRIHTTRECIEK